jgi:ribosomal protein S12 methylthiotransferase
MPLSVHIVTLGCPKNEVDSDRMAARLTAAGLAVTPDLDSADVAVVNTCAFIAEATEESVETVLQLAAGWKAARPGRVLVVAGCLASRYGDSLAGELPEADAFVPVAGENGVVRLLEGLAGVEPSPRDAAEPGRMPSGPSAYLKVADGCFRECAYCTIPYIRGGYVSRPLDELAAEARALAASGTRELVLVGQDVSAYGRDLGDEAPDLAAVVRTLARIDGVEWLRLMYVQPDGITPDLLETMASEPAVCHYLDMPLQHASREVLRRMRRKGSGDEFLRLLGVVRGYMPDIALRTTVIAGFPGETDTDVEVLEDMLLVARFDYVGVFEYSREEGTPAADMPAQVPSEVRRERARRLRDTADGVGFERAAEKVGSRVPVLALGTEDGEPYGRTAGQAPDVDGVVYLDRELEPGTITHAEIVDAAGYDLVGEVRA